MNAFEWLGSWEPCRYFGKHERTYPADGAVPYRFNPAIHGNDAWLRDWNRVCRAIPVTGTVEPISWKQSPQVRFWLDEPPKTIWELIKEWWRK